MLSFEKVFIRIFFFYIYKGKFYQGYWTCLHTQQKWSFPFPLIVKKNLLSECLNAWKVSDKIFVIFNSIADYTPMLEFLLWTIQKVVYNLLEWQGRRRREMNWPVQQKQVVEQGEGQNCRKTWNTSNVAPKGTYFSTTSTELDKCSGGLKKIKVLWMLLLCDPETMTR